MAMIRCPICGEKFSDTYRSCPFCEEEEALRQGEQIRRGVSQGGKRVAGRRQPSLLSPMLILVILILAALLVYLLYGDKLAQTLFGESAGQQVEETIQPDGQEDGDITMPEDGETDDTQTPPEGTDRATLQVLEAFFKQTPMSVWLSQVWRDREGPPKKNQWDLSTLPAMSMTRFR